MLTASNTNNNLSNKAWIKVDGHIEDFLILTEGLFHYYKKASAKISQINFIISGILKAIIWIFLFPIRLSLIIIGLPAYLIFASIFRFYFHRELNTIKQLHTMIKDRIASNTVTIEQLKEEHASTKKLLNDLSPRLQKLEGERIMKPSLDKLLNEIKRIELTERRAAYPERNEMVLTYDELVELNELTDLSF